MKIKIILLLLLICGLLQAGNPVAIWLNTLKSPDNQTITKTLTDSKGNVYVVGTYRTSLTFGSYTISSMDNQNMYIVKYNSSGNLLWAKSDGSGGVNLKSAAIDQSDNLILCGSFYGQTLSFGSIHLSNMNESGPTKYFVVKYNSDGNALWAKGNSNSILYTSAESVYADNSGNIYLAGTFQDNTFSLGPFVLTKSTTEHNNTDGFLAKLDATGNFLWATGISGSGSEFATNMVVDPFGNVYVAGIFNGMYADIGNVRLNNGNYIGYADLFLAKWNSSGEFIWARGAQGGRCEPTSINIDNSGNIYLGGQFINHELKFDQFVLTNSKSLNYSDWKGFIAKFNANGNAIWANQSSDETVGDINASMCIDKSGFIYSTGYFTSETLTLDTIKLTKSVQTGRDMYFCKYNAKGKIIWAQNVGCSSSTGVSVSVDKSGNLIMAGIYGLSDPTIYHPFNYFGLTNNGHFIAKILGDTTRLFKDQIFCKTDLSTTINAPANNKNYSWLNSNNQVISNTPTVIINNPVDSAIYTCKFKNTQDSLMIWKYTLIENKLNADFSFALPDCQTNTVQFRNLSTINTGNLTFLWDFGDGTTSTEESPLHSITADGSYQVNLSIYNSASHCTNSMSKSISYYKKPTISLTGDSTFCNNGTLLKAHGAYSYLWSNGSNADSINVSTAQKIWLVGYSASGCVSDTVYKTIVDIAPAPYITGSFKFCPGETATLKAFGAYRYEWSDGTMADSILINKETAIWMVAYSQAGCKADTLKLTVFQLPETNLTVDGSLNFCTGESSTLTASGATSYSWSTGEKTNTITVGKPGIYTVTGSNNSGCEKSVSINMVENNLPKAGFTLSGSFVDSRHNKLTGTVQLENAVNYVWDMGDGTTENGSNIEHTYNVSNIFKEYNITLTATNLSGCTSSSTKSIDINLFIPNFFSPDGNGVNDVFMPGVELEIFNRNGMSLYKGTDGWDGNYKGKKMSDDTYFYAISYKNKNGQVEIKKGYLILKR